MKSFGSTELEKCLKRLGFVKKPSTGSSHQKYSCPKAIEKGTRSFMIVILGRKVYDPITRKNIIRQIKKLGYTEEEIEKQLD